MRQETKVDSGYLRSTVDTMASSSWQEKVYQGSQDKHPFYRSEAWKRLREACLNRDLYRCKRCDKKYTTGRRLTVHHIVPRQQGGADDLSNLITLCDACHDYVEIQGLQTKAEIIGSYPDMGAYVEPKRNEPADENDWHTWVYGGAKRPCKG
jgi:predicted HNH restriction endonuclease